MRKIKEILKTEVTNVGLGPAASRPQLLDRPRYGERVSATGQAAKMSWPLGRKAGMRPGWKPRCSAARQRIAADDVTPPDSPHLHRAASATSHM